MSYLLHIETSTDICSIALSKNDQLLQLKEGSKGYSHAAEITLLIQAVLEDAAVTMKDLSAVILSSGPGSYTALRIGTSTAKGICYALDIPLIVVDTLKALAHATIQEKNIEDAYYFPMIDARRMEVYTAGFNSNLEIVAPLEAKIINETSFKELMDQQKSLVFSGNGAPKCQTTLKNSTTHFVPLICSAAYLVSLGYAAYQAQQFADVAYYTPVYFKAPNITTPKKKL